MRSGPRWHRHETRAGSLVLERATNRINRQILRSAAAHRLHMGREAEWQLTGGGRESLFVSFVAERWLQAAPRGALDFESGDAERALAALIDGWSSTVVHALAAQPLTLHELDRAVEALNRRELRKRIDAMRNAGLIEARPSEGEGAIYAVTDWLRAGIAPLMVAARLERRDPREEMAPIAPLDVEAAFLLVLPLLKLPAELSGRCRLSVSLNVGSEPRQAGVTVNIDAGRVSSCSTRLDPLAGAWASGSPGDWLDAVIEGDTGLVASGGGEHLVHVVLEGIHETLFGIPVPKES